MHKENTDTQRFIDSVKNTETYKQAQRCYDSIQNLNFKMRRKSRSILQKEACIIRH